MTGISTPAIPNVTLSKAMQPKTPDEEVDMNISYRELVGCLLYAAVITRPDISLATKSASKFMNNPGENTI
jgi:hypothetical protein